MAKVKDENRRIEQQNLDLAIQADETSKKINSLELALSESHKRGNALFQLLYKRELDAFIRKKKRQAIINLILFIVFLTSSIVVDWLSKKYKWSFLDGWLKEVCLYILPQLLVVGRSYVTKINPLKTFSILLGKENHNFEQEFKEQSTLAENINT